MSLDAPARPTCARSPRCAPLRTVASVLLVAAVAAACESDSNGGDDSSSPLGPGNGDGTVENPDTGFFSPEGELTEWRGGGYRAGGEEFSGAHPWVLTFEAVSGTEARIVARIGGTGGPVAHTQIADPVSFEGYPDLFLFPLFEDADGREPAYVFWVHPNRESAVGLYEKNPPDIWSGLFAIGKEAVLEDFEAGDLEGTWQGEVLEFDDGLREEGAIARFDFVTGPASFTFGAPSGAETSGTFSVPGLCDSADIEVTLDSAEHGYWEGTISDDASGCIDDVPARMVMTPGRDMLVISACDAEFTVLDRCGSFLLTRQ